MRRAFVDNERMACNRGAVGVCGLSRRTLLAFETTSDRGKRITKTYRKNVDPNSGQKRDLLVMTDELSVSPSANRCLNYIATRCARAE